MEGALFSLRFLFPPWKIAEHGRYSLIQFYPNFETQLRDSLGRLVGKKVEGAVEIGMARDGSGVGGKSTNPSSLRLTTQQPVC